jgi:hypothetical protein
MLRIVTLHISVSTVLDYDGGGTHENWDGDWGWKQTSSVAWFKFGFCEMKTTLQYNIG